jgi:DNA-binding beta-propeller fold protein YncE
MKICSYIRLIAVVLSTLACGLISATQKTSALKLVHKISLPALHDGDFDHFGKDLKGNRLFLTAEANGTVEVFDARSNKLIHTIKGLKSPHAILYRDDVDKLFVVDGDASEIKVYNATTYDLLGHIALSIDADSMAYDPATQYMYVVNGGREAKTPYSLISVIDTNNSTKLRDITIDTNWVEALLLESSGPRMFCVLTGKNAIGVMDRSKDSLIATWPTPADAKHPVSLGFNESGHRLFVATREPGKLVVLNSDDGKVIAELPAVGMVDDLSYDTKLKRLYLSGNGFVDVFSQKDPDHYILLTRVPGSFRAKTGLFVPEWNHYFLAVPRHQTQPAEVRVYDVQP